MMGFLQANIAMDEDKKEEQKKANVDRSKLEADIKAQTDLASKVGAITYATEFSSLYFSFLSLLQTATLLQGKHTEAVENLLTLEKQSRLSEDITSTKMCCKAILDVLYNAKDWQQLNEHILLLAKRRSQLKQVRDSNPGYYSLMCSGSPSQPTRFNSETGAGCSSICSPGNGLC